MPVGVAAAGALEKTSNSIPVLVIAAIYLSRVVSKLPLHPPTWRPLTLCALMAADKMQLDPSRPGGCYAYRHCERYGDLLPTLTAQELLRMELGFAGAAAWRFTVSPEQYEHFVSALLQETVGVEVQRACEAFAARRAAKAEPRPRASPPAAGGVTTPRTTPRTLARAASGKGTLSSGALPTTLARVQSSKQRLGDRPAAAAAAAERPGAGGAAGSAAPAERSPREALRPVAGSAPPERLAAGSTPA